MDDTTLTIPAGDGTPVRQRPRRRRGPAPVIRGVVVAVYLFFLIAWPLSLVVQNTFAGGLTNLTGTLTDPLVAEALRLTAVVAATAVSVNIVFGVGISMLLVRQEFPGKRLLSALVDLPLSVSPVVVGLAMILVYNPRTGWFGPTLDANGIQVLFATPSIILVTAFITLPLVIREVVPVLEEVGIEQEEAARSLGAGPWQTFRRITLPSIQWAIVYGIVLSGARAIGEFGAVKVVSGNLIGQTQTATLVVEERYLEFAQDSAFAIAFLLASISVAAIVTVSFIRPNHSKRDPS